MHRLHCHTHVQAAFPPRRVTFCAPKRIGLLRMRATSSTWWPLRQMYNLAYLHCKSAPSQRFAAARASKPDKVTKRRLDALCSDLAPEYSMTVIRGFILAGKVFVNNQKVTKSGAHFSDAANIDIRAQVPKYVCRAGYKLEKALDVFQIDVSGLTALDSGLSTGGFTDCLLQRGASKVYGVDVGYGQVAEKIRVDPRVVIMERTNLRTLETSSLPMPVDIATLDLSFISVLKVMPAVTAVLKASGHLIVLIKPQFEAGQAHIARGGVVHDEAVQQAVVERVTCGIEALGFQHQGLTESPIRGAQSGNREFLAHFHRTRSPPPMPAWAAKWLSHTADEDELGTDMQA